MNKITSVLITLFLCHSMAFSQTQSDELINSGDILSRGLELYSNGEYKQALQEYKKIHRNDTNYVVAISEIAVTYFQDKQYQEAYDASISGLNLYSEYDNNFYNTACIALKSLKKYKEAEELYKVAIEKHPYEFLLYFNRGIMHEETRQIDLAIKDYEDALSINPMHAYSHFRLGRIYALNHKPVQGMMAMQMALILEPDNSNAFNILRITEETVLGSLPETADSVKVNLAQDNFSELEELIKSKVCLAKGYKNKTKINYILPKQNQLMLEKLSYNPNDKDFFNQMYTPFYTEVAKKGYLEPMVYMFYASVNDDEIQSVVKKNMSKIKDFYKWGNDYLKVERKYRTQITDASNDKLTRYFYSDNRIEAKGLFKDEANSIKIGKWFYYHDNGLLSDIQNYNDNGKLEGEWISYYKTGSLKSVSNFSNGKRNGQNTSYYSNGVKEFEYPAVNDMAQGEYRSYYPSGQLKKSIQFKDDKKNGLTVTYYIFGVKESEINYADDKREGEYKEYYETGELMEVSNFKADLLDGPFTSYHKNGKVKVECVTKAEIISGKWTQYYEKGNVYMSIVFDDKGVIKEKKTYYEDGKSLQFELIINDKDLKKTTEKEYFESGKLYSLFNYENGLIKDYKIYDEQGNVISEAKETKGLIKIVNRNKAGGLINTGEYLKGKQNGEWTYYDYNGNVKSKFTFVDGKAEGNAYEYFPDGSIYREYSYVNDEINGLSKTYYKNHSLVTKGWYVNGLRQGEWWEYFSNGSVENKFYYLNDEARGYREYFAADGKKLSEEYYQLNLLNKVTYYDSSGIAFYDFSIKNGTGDYITKFPTKQVNAKGKYVNGFGEGEYVWTYANGKLSTKGAYHNDKKTGKYISYFENGKVKWEGTYENNEPVGEWVWYFDNGKKLKGGYYTKGVMDSLWIYYNENGKKEYEATYKNGEREGFATYFSRDGDLQLRKTFKKGRFISYTYPGKDGKFIPEIPVKNEDADVIGYFQNGQKSVEETVEKSYYEGKRVFYYPNGKKETESNYKANMKEGEDVNYYSNGKVKAKEMYLYDELNGKAVYFRENGIKEKEGEYLLGERHGIWRFYDESGNLVKTVTYWYDQPILENKNGKNYAEK